MTRSRFFAARCGVLLLAFGLRLVGAENVDIVVYGATPGGIAAAIAAAKGGESVLLVEPSIRIGGMTTNGLSHPDFRGFESITGTYLDLVRRTLAYYTEKYGADSQQVKDTFRGTHAEPKVNLLLFQQMIAEQPRIAVKTKWLLADLKTRGATGERYIQSALFRDDAGRIHEFAAKVFIDGSYEGDLMAAAHVAYRVGREGREEFGESLAPEAGDGELQGYNFRLCMTQDPVIRIPVTAPKGYRREDFAGMLPLIESGKLKRVFGGYQDKENAFKAQIPVLPNNKRDINDVSGGLIRMSLPGDQLGWPEGDASVRQKIYDEHVLWNVGVMYFLQNDAAVPAAMREEARTYGWCRDEFVESGHIPPQLYVREARRMVGLRFYTQADTDYAPDDARCILHHDSIAMGDYGHSSHGTSHEGSRFGGKRIGEMGGHGVPPYQVPYGVLVPKDVRNLLVPVAASASHVGFCALRLEPIWTSMGQAAGHAAHLAIAAKGAAPDVRTMKVPQLQRRLHADGLATIYMSDVLPGHPDFAAVQWWGMTGGFQGMAPTPTKRGLRGKSIMGQHSEATPDHAANLGMVLDPALGTLWAALARDTGLTSKSLPTPNGRVTRGDWIRAAFKAAK